MLSLGVQLPLLLVESMPFLLVVDLRSLQLDDVLLFLRDLLL